MDLPQPGFADEAQGLAEGEREADPIHRLDVGDRAPEQPPLNGEVHLQPLDLQHGPGLGRPLGRRRRDAHAAIAPARITSSAKWQAARWPSPTGRSGGASRRQGSAANGHRGAKAQPAMGSRSDGTRPGISASRRFRAAPRERGIEAIRPARVGVGRAVEQLQDRRFLDLEPGIHHEDAPAELGHHAEIVGDQDHGRAGALLQLPHQLQDLGLDRHVEGRGRLVGDEQLRPAGERHGDHHALAHPAGELVRVVVEPPLRLRNAQQFEHGGRPPPPLGAARALVDADRFPDLLADREHRVEAGHRLLEDHGDAVAADAPHGRLVEGKEVRALEVDAAPDRAGEALGQEPHHGERGHALAAARLSDDAQRLAREYVEAEAAHGAGDAVRREEVGL